MNFKVREKIGDLLAAPQDWALAVSVGGDFVMGRGIALRFKEKYGGVAELTNQNVKKGECAYLLRDNRYIFYLVSRNLSRQRPNYNSLGKCLTDLKEKCLQFGVTKVAMPKIGSGLEKGSWLITKQTIYQIFRGTGIEIKVYYSEPADLPEWTMKSYADLPEWTMKNTKLPPENTKCISRSTTNPRFDKGKTLDEREIIRRIKKNHRHRVRRTIEWHRKRNMQTVGCVNNEAGCSGPSMDPTSSIALLSSGCKTLCAGCITSMSNMVASQNKRASAPSQTEFGINKMPLTARNLLAKGITQEINHFSVSIQRKDSLVKETARQEGIKMGPPRPVLAQTSLLGPPPVPTQTSLLGPWPGASISTRGSYVLPGDRNQFPNVERPLDRFIQGPNKQTLDCASISTRGSYVLPGDRNQFPNVERPLDRFVQGPNTQTLDLAIQRKDLLMKEIAAPEEIKIGPPPPPPVLMQTSLPGMEKVIVGLEHAPSTFDVLSKVLGRGGANLQYINKTTGAVVTLRGRTSGYPEPGTRQESPEPLHICVEHQKMEVLQSARQLAADLIETIREELARLHPQQLQPPPHLQMPQQQVTQLVSMPQPTMTVPQLQQQLPPLSLPLPGVLVPTYPLVPQQQYIQAVGQPLLAYQPQGGGAEQNQLQTPSGQLLQTHSGQLLQTPSGQLLQTPSGQLLQTPSGQLLQTPSGSTQQLAMHQAQLVQLLLQYQQQVHQEQLFSPMQIQLQPSQTQVTVQQIQRSQQAIQHIHNQQMSSNQLPVANQQSPTAQPQGQPQNPILQQQNALQKQQSALRYHQNPMQQQQKNIPQEQSLARQQGNAVQQWHNDLQQHYSLPQQQNIFQQLQQLQNQHQGQQTPLNKVPMSQKNAGSNKTSSLQQGQKRRYEGELQPPPNNYKVNTMTSQQSILNFIQERGNNFGVFTEGGGQPFPIEPQTREVFETLNIAYRRSVTSSEHNHYESVTNITNKMVCTSDHVQTPQTDNIAGPVPSRSIPNEQQEGKESQQSGIKVATWDVSGAVSQITRNLIDEELQRSDCSVATLQRTQLPTGWTNTQTFDWLCSGAADNQETGTGVALLISRTGNVKLNSFDPISDSCCKGRILWRDQILTVISAHLPPSLDQQYPYVAEQIRHTVTSAEHPILLMGNFNAHIGLKDLADSEKERFGPALRYVDTNENGVFLKALAAAKDLIFVSTFTKGRGPRTTWSNRGYEKNNTLYSQIDYILLSRQSALQNHRTDAMWSKREKSDHKMVIAHLTTNSLLFKLGFNS